MSLFYWKKLVTKFQLIRSPDRQFPHDEFEIHEHKYLSTTVMYDKSIKLTVICAQVFTIPGKCSGVL